MKNRGGFTIVEIAIVILIVGMLVAIAVPNFVRSREIGQASACIANLAKIEDAKYQWARDGHKQGTDVPTIDELRPYFGPSGQWPVCPGGGHYEIGDVDHNPSCSLAAARIPHILGP